MSQENVEKVRAYLATWDGEMLRPESRPFQRITSMEVTVALYAPDYVYEDAILPDHVGESYRGLDASVRAAETWIEPYEWLVVDLDQIIDAGACVLTASHWRATGKDSGLEVDLHTVDLVEFADGKIVRITIGCADKAEALKAVGLE